MRAEKREKIPGKDIIRRRMVFVFVVVVLVFGVLGARIGWIQVVATDKYASRAAERQIKDEIIPAKRGDILDRNMKELAVSTTSYRIWVRLRPYQPTAETDDEKVQKENNQAAELLSTCLGMEKAKILEKFETTQKRVRVAKNVNKDQLALIKSGIKDKELSNIEIEEDSSRNYPLGTFAAHVLGSVDNEGNGRSGIEFQYNQYLSGITGRRILNTDGNGNPLSSGEQMNKSQQDGLNVVLTIDETIQYYVEKAIEKAHKDMKAKGVQAIVMDPKNGDVLAMAAVPNYDPNTPGVPADEKDKEAFDAMTATEQTEYLNKIWRNPLVSDLYDPGSPFKLVTVSAGLENSVITPGSQFHCGASYKVSGQQIKCWGYPTAHGTQTVEQAVGNSCNPVMIQIVQNLGYERFYQYMTLFGITEKTGIDFPGEAGPLIQNKDNITPVDLATMAFGQGLSITPVQMATAVSAIGNDGKLMRPRLVRGLADSSGKMVQTFPTKIERQVISKQTSEEVRDIMEYVVNNTSAQIAQVPGYRIGGKTGTAQKLKNGLYSHDAVMGSMVAMAPMEDPQFIVLVVVDEPAGGGFGSTTAGPAVKEILTEILRYKNIKPAAVD